MVEIGLEIKNCYYCPWKTEYHGDPADYWMCDQVPGRIIPSKYLKEETDGVPWFCDWRKKPVMRCQGTHPPPGEDGSLPMPEWAEKKEEPTVEEAVMADLTYYKLVWVYWLTVKYWFQGDKWNDAKVTALAIVAGWKR